MAILIKNTNNNKTRGLIELFKNLIKPEERIVISSFESYKKLKNEDYGKKIIATSSIAEGLHVGNILSIIKGSGKLVFTTSETFEKILSYKTFKRHIFVFFRGKDNINMPFTIKEILSLQKSYKSLYEEIKNLKTEKEFLTNELKKLKEERRELNKKIKEENKKLKEEFKKVLKETPKEARKFLKEPEYKEEIKKSKEELKLEEKLSNIKLSLERKQITFKTIRREITLNAYHYFYSYFYIVKGKINGDKLFIVLPRKNSNSVSIEKILLPFVIKKEEEEFKDFLKGLIEKDKEMVDLNKITIPFPLYDTNILSFVSENEISNEEIEDLFPLDTVTKRKEKEFIPLAPLDPMQSASIIGGGIGAFAKELEIEGEPVILKGSVIKEYKKIEKRTIEGKETRIIDSQAPKIGIYYKDRKEVEMLG